MVERIWRTRLIVPLVGLVGALGLAACGSSDDSSDSTSASGGSGTIGFLLPETETARYETQDKPLFEQKVAELCPDCDILYQNADQDPTKQQSQVEAMVTQGVDVMVLDPVDSTSAAGMVTRATQADIPVISYDRLILERRSRGLRRVQQPEVGKQQGTALSEKLADDGNPKGPIVQINGDPKDNNAKLFKEGATSVFQARGSRSHKEYDTPDWLPENAQTEMDQAITAIGKTGSTASRDERRHRRRRDRGDQGGGHRSDDDPGHRSGRRAGAIQRILAGEQYMTVYKPIKPLADNAAKLAVAVVNGEDPASSDVINGEEDNETEQVPAAITDTIPVLRRTTSTDTVVKDGYWSAKEICTAAVPQDCKDAGI